jgi:hypothetical protein
VEREAAMKLISDVSNEDFLVLLTKDLSLLIDVNGKISAVEPDRASFSLAEMHEAVESDLVQIIPSYLASHVILVDEEGKIKGLPLNPIASLLHRNSKDPVVGRALFCTRQKAGYPGGQRKHVGLSKH